MLLSNTLMLTLAILPSAILMTLIILNAKPSSNSLKKVSRVLAVSAITCIPAAFIEWVLYMFELLCFLAADVDISEMTEKQQLIFYFIQYVGIVATVEESCKYLTFKVIVYGDRVFDNTYDGLIYGAASALGFATFENLMYVINAKELTLIVCISRAILSIPLHAVTGLIMGYYFGVTKYKLYNNIPQNNRPELKAFIFSVIIHGAYDFITVIPSVHTDEHILRLSLLILAGLLACVYVLMTFLLITAKKEALSIYNDYYYEELDGCYQDQIKKTTHDKFKLLSIKDKEKYADNYKLIAIEYIKESLKFSPLMTCEKCGEKFLFKVNYCSNCGNKLNKDNDVKNDL